MNASDILGDVSIAETTFTGFLVAVVFFVVRALLKGDLMTKAQHEAIVDEKNRRLNESNLLTTNLIPLVKEQQDAIRDLSEGVTNLGDAAAVQVKVAEALRAIADPHPPDGAE